MLNLIHSIAVIWYERKREIHVCTSNSERALTHSQSQSMQIYMCIKQATSKLWWFCAASAHTHRGEGARDATNDDNVEKKTSKIMLKAKVCTTQSEWSVLCMCVRVSEWLKYILDEITFASRCFRFFRFENVPLLWRRAREMLAVHTVHSVHTYIVYSWIEIANMRIKMNPHQTHSLSCSLGDGKWDDFHCSMWCWSEIAALYIHTNVVLFWCSQANTCEPIQFAPFLRISHSFAHIHIL